MLFQHRTFHHLFQHQEYKTSLGKHLLEVCIGSVCELNNQANQGVSSPSSKSKYDAPIIVRSGAPQSHNKLGFCTGTALCLLPQASQCPENCVGSSKELGLGFVKAEQHKMLKTNLNEVLNFFIYLNKPSTALLQQQFRALQSSGGNIFDTLSSCKSHGSKVQK